MGNTYMNMKKKFNWLSVLTVFILVWMIYVGWALYVVVTRPLWPVVTMTYTCKSDKTNCDWKWPTQILGK